MSSTTMPIAHSTYAHAPETGAAAPAPTASAPMTALGKVTRRFVPMTIMFIMMVLMTIVGSVSAVNWTPLTDLLAGLGTDVLPALLDFILAAVPIIVAIAFISFIVGLFIAILDMLKIKF